MRSLKRMALAAVAAAFLTVGTGAALAAVQTGTYRGPTSQVFHGVRGGVRVVVVPGAVRSMTFGFRANCRVHNSALSQVVFTRNVKIRNGRFGRTTSFAYTTSRGLSAGLGFSLSGQFGSPGRVSGTFSVRVTFRNPDGSIFDRCNALGIAWRASK